MKRLTQKSTTDQGAYGEQLARHYLEQKGMRFVAANWKCRCGEIDLIMDDKRTRVIVEVRLRAQTSFGEGLETVGYQKQQKIIRTTLLYQQAMNFWGDLRFDVISITIPANSTPVINHIPHAFST